MEINGKIIPEGGEIEEWESGNKRGTRLRNKIVAIITKVINKFIVTSTVPLLNGGEPCISKSWGNKPIMVRVK